MANKKNIITAVSAIILLFVFFVVFHYRQEMEVEKRHDELHYGVRLTSTGAMAKSEHNREMVIKRAKVIRDKWEIWAKKNKNVLDTMATINVDDSEALKQLYDQLPGANDIGTEKIGLVRSDLGIIMHTMDDYARQDSPTFCWNILHLPNIKEPNPYLLKLFKTHRDFPLAQSMGGMALGRNQITLWTSGRVTEDIIEERKNPKKGETYLSGPVENIIYPPYEFLTKGKPL